MSCIYILPTVLPTFSYTIHRNNTTINHFIRSMYVLTVMIRTLFRYICPRIHLLSNMDIIHITLTLKENEWESAKTNIDKSQSIESSCMTFLPDNISPSWWLQLCLNDLSLRGQQEHLMPRFWWAHVRGHVISFLAQTICHSTTHGKGYR